MGVGYSSARLERLASTDPGSATLVRQLLDIAVSGLTRSYQDGEFVFRLDGSPDPGGLAVDGIREKPALLSDRSAGSVAVA